VDRAAVVQRLQRAGCIAAGDEADALVAAAGTAEVLGAWVARREQGEPLAWITGTTAFCGRTLRIDPGVYVPRLQTQELAARAARLLPVRGRAADLCTGSGAVAAHLTATQQSALVVAVDRDPAAVRCARRNGVRALVGDGGAPLAADAFHLVTAVAPYVPTDEVRFLPRDVIAHEPRAALDGGADGLAVVRTVVTDAARILRTGGSLMLEIGGDQLEVATDVLSASGFADIEPWTDDEGDLRGVAANRRR
jgi:release factor glutamine methyltransferase